MSKVKLTNAATCRIVANITKDPNHNKCPIVMNKSAWLAIKPAVMWQKEQDSRNSSYDGFSDKVFGNGSDLFNQLFGSNNTFK